MLNEMKRFKMADGGDQWQPSVGDGNDSLACLLLLSDLDDFVGGAVGGGPVGDWCTSPAP